MTNMQDIGDFVESSKPQLDYKRIIKIKIGNKLENELSAEEQDTLETIMAQNQNKKPFKYEIKIIV